MCGRYVEVQKVEVIEQRFNVSAPSGLGYQPSYNISPGQFAPVITNDNPSELQLFQFGLTPFWAKKPMYLFNARAEGDKNKDNNPAYSGSKEIFRKPAFRKQIRSQRCLVIADAFIEGTTEEGLSKPYVVYLRNSDRPFAFAGIWDSWRSSETGEILNTFSIITTVANSLIQKLPHHRSPVILSREDEKRWLSSDISLEETLEMLKPYPPELMNAYPISSRVKNPKEEGRHLLEPTGNPVEPEQHFDVKKGLRKEGMGNRKRK
ncbi:MAG: SOS response-associated peptidase [Bacteroidales bacterium]